VSEAGFGGVDLDRLADYVGGALDGTPDAAVVADLVATDARWADAYAALTAADAAVRADLAELAAVPEPMPADVAARLAGALGTAPPERSALDPIARPAGAAPRAAGEADRDAGPVGTGPRRGRSPAGPVGAYPPAGRPGRAAAARRRRTTRLAMTLATAAAVVVCAVGGLALVDKVLRPGTGGVSSFGRDSTAAQPGGAAAPQYAPSGPPAPRLLASGTDYQPGTVGSLLTGRTAQPSLRGAEPTKGAANSAPDAGTESAPSDLRRLSEPTALAACLAAVVRQYGGTVTVVDYARFQGTAALVILVTGASGDPNRQWVVVVGAACGAGGATTGELYNGPAA
jgi:hypothetical protein